MKYKIRQITEGDEEVILHYRELTPEIERILHFMNGMQNRLAAWKEKTLTMLEPDRILYIESVDGKTYAYTREEVLRLDEPLSRLEQMLGDVRFFRCSKSMIVNIDQVERLRSLPSNRIDATMKNGEHIMISRTYASDFRKRLRGGAE